MFTKEGLIESFRYPFSSQAIEVFNLAEEEARMLGHGYIGGEHLLLGVARLRLPPLEELGIDIRLLPI